MNSYGIDVMNTRYYGLDLLRVVSMLGIISLHILGNGGVLDSANGNSLNHFMAYGIEILCMTSVNIFAMMSGFLYIQKPPNKMTSKSIFQLLFLVAFYCAIICIGFRIFRPELFTNLKFYIKALFPPICGRYWYIVSYTFLFFMIPYINKLLLSFKKEEHFKFISIIFIFLSVITTIGRYDYFKIIDGYSPFWLLFCYIVGAYINLYMTSDKKINKKFFLIVYLIILILIPIMGKQSALLVYNSPFIMVTSVVIMLLFKNINIKGERIKKFIVKLSGYAFSVYIIHCNILIYDFIIKDNFKFISNYNFIIMGLLYFAVIISIYLICVLIDMLRKILFKLFKVDNLIKFISVKLDKVIY